MKWTLGLNPEQSLAVQHNYGPMLILAGAGSGKTTVLIARTGRLISEKIALPENILVLTFTNKAARELKHRVAQKLGKIGLGLQAGTFHSFGLRMLREFHEEANLPKYFGVIDQSDAISILKEVMKEIKISGKDKFDLQNILELINQQRVRGMQKKGQKLEAFDEYHEMATVLLPKYLKKLEIRGAVDFEGLLLKPIELLKNHPQILNQIHKRYDQIMVDEFQDTNATQMELINLILNENKNLSVVGDDDQSIYGWRGAEIKNILNFPKLFKSCEVIRLERNYRSTPQILEFANDVIKNNKHRHGKILKPESKLQNKEIPEIFTLENEQEEVDFVIREVQSFLQNKVLPKEIAILYRSNAQGAMMETYFRQQRLPYTVSGGTAFFDRKEIKDVIAYLRFALQPNEVSLRRVINTPARGIGDTSLEKITEYAKQHKLTFYKSCLDWQKIGLGEKVGNAIIEFFQWEKKLLTAIINTNQSGANLLLELRSIGFRDLIYQSSASGEAADKKWQWVEIFSRILDSFMQKGGATEKSLSEFLDAMELRDQQDDEEQENKISLMTLHASKGLEFPIVFLLGVEEDLLPHKSLGSNIDEERRLFYVGITRAKEKLLLTRCKQRTRNGQLKPVSISRFILEVSKDLFKSHDNGFRPVTEVQREKLVSDFLAKLEKR